jgi:hypothetical protein
MYDPPSYLWAITIAGIIAIPAATCVVLYGGAVRGGLGRTRAALLAGGAAVVLGGWFTASAVIAGHGWYRTLALTLGALTGFQLLTITPSSAPITQLPLALIPTATVPLLFALHITSVTTLVRAPRTRQPATAPLTAAAS